MRRAALAPLLALLLGACAGGPTLGGNTGTCRSNADCAGATCDSTRHVCVSPSAVTTVQLFATPMNDHPTTNAARTWFDPQMVASGVSADLVLRSQRRVNANVVAVGADGAPVSLLAATVEFRRVGASPNEPPVLATAGTMSLGGSGDGAYNLQTTVAVGSYSIAVRPMASDTWPPMYLEAQVPESSTLVPVPMVIAYQPTAELPLRLVDQSTGLPVPGVYGYALDRSTGRLLSTATQSDAVGVLRLRLTPGALASQVDWAVRLGLSPASASATADPALSGRLTLELSRAYLSPRLDPTGSAVTVALPRGSSFVRPPGSTACDACVVYGAEINDRSGAQLSGEVLLRSENVLAGLPEGQSAWFEARVRTGADGTFHASVMPGTYRATVLPDDASFAITATDGVVVRDDGSGVAQFGAALRVRSRVNLTGLVLSENGARVAAQLEAWPWTAQNRAPLGPNDLTILARYRSANTDARGSFTLALDEGQYALVVRPVRSSGFAPAVLPFQAIAWIPSSADASVPVDITAFSLPRLATPLVVQGRVRDASSQPAQGALITAFARVMREDATTPLVLELGSATADNSGNWSLLLTP